jgi:hypothetical protein
MKKINIKLIVFHLLSAVLLIWAFRQLNIFYDIDLVKSLSEKGYEKTFTEFGAIRMLKFSYYQNVIPLIGILLGFLISLTFTIIKKLGVINSIIMFFVSILLNMTGLLHINYIEYFIFAPGRLIFNSVIWTSIFNGSLFLFLGLWVQFSRHINRMIVKKYEVQTHNIL